MSWRARNRRGGRYGLGLNRMGRYRRPNGRRNRRGGVLLADGIEHIARLGDMRKVDLGLDYFFALGAVWFGVLGRGWRFAAGAKMSSDFFGLVLLQRTGMRLLLGDPQLRKDIGDRLAFDFQLSGQIVDSNLTHPPLFPPGYSARPS